MGLFCVELGRRKKQVEVIHLDTPSLQICFGSRQPKTADKWRDRESRKRSLEFNGAGG